MHVNAIKDHLAAKPFEPFEIILSSGDRFPVHHPENVLLTKERAIVAYSTSRRDAELPEGAISISYLHIAAIEPMPPKPKSKARA